MKEKIHLSYGWIAFVVAAATMIPANAQNKPAKPVFTIGTFDRSSAEFAGGAPKQQVFFTVGKSRPDKDWYASQPAEIVATGGVRQTSDAAAPRTITFALANAPAVAYELHISLLIEGASVPALRISINDKHGRFYLHPKLDSTMGDMIDSFDPAYAHADVVFTFPGNYLHSGTNTITLQAIEEVDRAVPDAGLTYDAIELDRSTEAVNPRTSTAHIIPTIFYQQRQGRLNELVDVFLQYGERVKSGSSADLAIEGKHYH